MVTDKLLKGRRDVVLDQEERAAIEAAVSEVRSIPARTVVIEAGMAVRQCALLVEGSMCRYIDDREGLRQLVAFHVPGDFVDLHSYAQQTLEHDVATVTEAKMAIIPHDKIRTLTADSPELTRKLWFATLLDAAMHRAWLFRLGRLDSMGRLAHFLCETNARLKAVGLSDGSRFQLDLTQNDLAEICGVTSIHVNRILRELREEGMCTYRSSWVEIPRPDLLAARGQFDNAYLYLDESPARSD